MGKKYSNEYLIEKLQKKAEEIGKTPTRREVKADKEMPGIDTYHSHFGTWNNAVEAAKLEVNLKQHDTYTKEEVLDLLRKKAEELGRTPGRKDIDADENMPSVPTYAKHFGSYNAAVKALGLKPNIELHEKYTKNELIATLQKKAKELGRAPFTKEIDADENMPDSSTFYTHFGTYNKALKAAGLDTNIEQHTDEELLDMLKKKAKELDRAPTIAEIDEDENMPSVRPYCEHFGSFNNAINAAGLNVNIEFFTDKQLLDLLKEKAEELGRTPTTREMEKDKSMPSSVTYAYHFGSYSAALEAAGLELNRKYSKKRPLKKRLLDERL